MGTGSVWDDEVLVTMVVTVWHQGVSFSSLTAHSAWVKTANFMLGVRRHDGTESRIERPRVPSQAHP